MAPVAQQLRQAAAAGKPLVREVPAKCLVTQPVTIHTLDIATMKPEDQDFSVEFTLDVREAETGASEQEEGTSGDDHATTAGTGAAAGAEVAALVLWFDVEFSKRFCRDHPVVLSTSPEAPTTHWVQTVLPLRQVEVLGGAGGKGVGLKCRLSMARSKRQHRTLDMSLEYQKVDGEGNGVGSSCVAVYVMDVTGGE
jgi:protein arginine N-methyltransferase 3